MSTLLWKVKSRIETFFSSTKKNQQLLDSFLKKIARENVFFVEIGANDGIDADPIYPYVKKYNWGGVYIEPQKKVFDKLVANFKGRGNLFFENIAITEKEMDVELFVPKANGDINSSLMASLSTTGGNIPFFNDVEKETVKGLPFSYIVDKYSLKEKEPVFLLIDVEGYEKTIIFSIDFDSYKPRYIFFEHDHLTHNTHRIINHYLTEKGYKIYLLKYDTLACLS